MFHLSDSVCLCNLLIKQFIINKKLIHISNPTIRRYSLFDISGHFSVINFPKRKKHKPKSESVDQI